MKGLNEYIAESFDPVLGVKQQIYNAITQTDSKVKKSKEFKEMLKEVFTKLCEEYDITL